MIIMFVRHAEDLKDELTERGKKQCDTMIDYNEEYTFSKIYTSPAKRCVDTAKALNKKFGLEIQVEKDIIEREGLSENTPKNKKEKEWYDNYLNPEYSSKDPEGCKEYLERTHRCFRKIIDAHFDKNENAIIVAHSVTTYALCSFIYGVRPNEDIKWIRVGNCAKLYFEINEKV